MSLVDLFDTGPLVFLDNGSSVFLDIVPLIRDGFSRIGTPDESGRFFIWILAVRVSIIQQYKHNTH